MRAQLPGRSRLVLVVVLTGLVGIAPAQAQPQQDAESKALDATATQWSFQFAYQLMPNYHADMLSSGMPRPPGSDNYLQVRVVAPLPLGGLTILPRLTVRHYENAQGESGLGNTELFALLVPKAFDWGIGRFGIGPLVTMPGSEKVARDEWGYGLAAVVVHAPKPWFLGLLFTQSWRGIVPTALPPGDSDANPLGIAPIITYQLGKGFYASNGDMVLLYDWNSKNLYAPIGLRLGKVIINRNSSTWNLYAEYQTSLIYKSYPGPAVKDLVRLNVSYAIPLKF